MFEHITYEELIKRMVDRALTYNKNLDSREGSLLFLAEAPAAVELQNLYIALDTVLRETFADTASRPYLIQRALERALEPYPRNQRRFGNDNHPARSPPSHGGTVFHWGIELFCN